MSRSRNPHIVFFPSPGMGHLTPFLRLASNLSSRNCMITLIVSHPIISPEESTQLSSFFSNHPSINCLDFNIIQEKSISSPSDDAFISQFKAINSSIHLLPSLLSSLSHKISAIIHDFAVAATLSKLVDTLSISSFILSTTSARCYSTVAYLPTLLQKGLVNNDFPENIEIPNLAPLPKSIIPPSWLDNSPSNRLVQDYLIPNALSLTKVNGILLNSFDWFEPETILSVLGKEILNGLPPVYPIGPLEPYKDEKNHYQWWLDTRPKNSVVFVNFGIRTMLSDEQINEIGKGLEKSRYFFIWVLNELLNDNEFKDFLEKTKDKGIVVQGVVNQAEISKHPSIGCFVSQCDWDAVMDAVREGVVMLAWPQHGDHKMGAEVVERAGLGLWVKEWGWGGERVVGGEEFSDRLREIMENQKLKERAMRAKEEARRACEVDGSSENALNKVIHLLKHGDDHAPA